MGNILPHFNVDLAGTFLVPQSLIDAREKCRNNQLTATELHAVENNEIRNLVEKQKNYGLKVVTDGNFRNNSSLADFMCSLDGIQLDESKKKFQLTHRIDTLRRHPVVDDFMFLTGITGGDVIAKQVLPAPSFVYSRLIKDASAQIAQFYPDSSGLIDDIDRIYNRLINKLYSSGCRYIQFDDTTRVISNEAIHLNNRILAGLPDDLFIAFHAPADMLIATERVNAFFLDYDDECCSRYKLLWFIKEKRATFGFIPSYYPGEEDLEELRSKIDEVRRYIPLDRFTLCIPNAHQLPSEKYELAEEKQWHTLDMAKRVAGELWP